MVIHLQENFFLKLVNYNVHDKIPEFDKTIGETLLEPSYIYNHYIQLLLQNNIQLKGMAHISGGGLVENIPRILPNNCAVEILNESWNVLPVFKKMQKLGNVDEIEMFRTFNMGIGLVVIINDIEVEKIFSLLKAKFLFLKLEKLLKGNQRVKFI